LEHHAHPWCEGGAVPNRVGAKDLDEARLSRADPGTYLHGGGLPGPIASQNRRDEAARNHHVQISDGRDVAIAHRETPNFDCRIPHAQQCTGTPLLRSQGIAQQ